MADMVIAVDMVMEVTDMGVDTMERGRLRLQLKLMLSQDTSEDMVAMAMAVDMVMEVMDMDVVTMARERLKLMLSQDTSEDMVAMAMAVDMVMEVTDMDVDTMEREKLKLSQGILEDMVVMSNPSEGSIPMQAQESSITGSYNRVIIPVKSPSLEHYDDFFSSEEDVKTTLENDSISSKLVINWNMRSDTTLEILEPSRTSHSITFPKTNLEKHQTDIKDRPQGFVSERPESDQIKPRRHNRKLTLESVIILENSKINAPVPESKSNGYLRDRGEDNKNQPVYEE